MAGARADGQAGFTRPHIIAGGHVRALHGGVGMGLAEVRAPLYEREVHAGPAETGMPRIERKIAVDRSDYLEINIFWNHLHHIYEKK